MHTLVFGFNELTYCIFSSRQNDCTIVYANLHVCDCYLPLNNQKTYTNTWHSQCVNLHPQVAWVYNEILERSTSRVNNKNYVKRAYRVCRFVRCWKAPCSMLSNWLCCRLLWKKYKPVYLNGTELNTPQVETNNTHMCTHSAVTTVTMSILISRLSSLHWITCTTIHHNHRFLHCVYILYPLNQTLPLISTILEP